VKACMSQIREPEYEVVRGLGVWHMIHPKAVTNSVFILLMICTDIGGGVEDGDWPVLPSNFSRHSHPSFTTPFFCLTSSSLTRLQKHFCHLVHILLLRRYGFLELYNIGVCQTGQFLLSFIALVTSRTMGLLSSGGLLELRWISIRSCTVVWSCLNWSISAYVYGGNYAFCSISWGSLRFCLVSYSRHCSWVGLKGLIILSLWNAGCRTKVHIQVSATRERDRKGGRVGLLKRIASEQWRDSFQDLIRRDQRANRTRAVVEIVRTILISSLFPDGTLLVVGQVLR